MDLLLLSLALLGILALNCIAWLLPLLLRVIAYTLAVGLIAQSIKETETQI
jgi:hypothetical protein